MADYLPKCVRCGRWPCDGHSTLPICTNPLCPQRKAMKSHGRELSPEEAAKVRKDLGVE